MSGTLPGPVHDLRAARIWGIVRALADAGLLVLADKGYIGAGQHITTPDKGRHKPESQKTSNRSHAKLRFCPHRAGHLAKTIHVLQTREANA